MGAEPNEIDVGPYAGTTIFRDEEKIGLQLMQSLTQDQKDRAQIYKLMKDPAMPEGAGFFRISAISAAPISTTASFPTRACSRQT